jgi:endonuclease YncB( thermonuclease family)
VISIYDGDTIRVNINNLPPIIGQNIRIRLSNIDTPEIKGQCSREKKLALIARDRLRQLVNNAHTIEIHNLQRGKYFRIVADLMLDGQNASDILINENLGVPYKGGKKIHSWC